MPTQLGNELKLGIPIDADRGELTLSPEDRSKHLYVVGASGAGKSKFLEGLVQQDIEQWGKNRSGLLLIDPDGTIFDGVMEWLATRPFRIERPIIPIDFRRDDWVVSYNPLRRREGLEASVAVNNFVSAVAHVWGDESVEKTPLFARYAKSLIQALYERGGSVPDAVFFLDLAERAMREGMIKEIVDGDSRAAWEYAHNLKPDRFMDELGSTIRRLHPFTYNRLLRATFGSPTRSLDLMAALEEGQIILLCLAQKGGKIDQTDAKLYATTLLADLWQTAGQRGKGDEVKPFYVYIDEFQEYLNPTIATTFSRARGYGLHFTLAHQFPSQVIEAGGLGKRIFDAIIGNADSIVAFRQRHPNDVEMLAKLLFMGTFDPYAIKRELYSTKVLDYEKVILRAESESSGSNRGGGRQSSESIQYDEDGNLVGGSSQTMGDSDSWGDSESKSKSKHEAFRPVLGLERSSVESLSLDEQLLLAVAALQTQGDRHAVARLAGRKVPVTFRTLSIEKAPVRKKQAEEYRDKILKALPSAMPFTEALKELESRHEDIRKQLTGSQAEPSSAARPLRRP